MSGTIIEPRPGGEVSASAKVASPDEASAWQALLAWRDGGADPAVSLAAAGPAVAALVDLYRPFCAATQGRSIAIGHLGQSLDGRIATASGLSRWVTGPADLLHTHRMRALADAVIVGAGTVRHDDPLLTVRRCPGPHPVRVVIDPERRLGAEHRVFRDTCAPTLVLAATDCAGPGARLDGVEIVRLPRDGAGLSPRDIVAALAERGLFRLFVEGGGLTVSRFLAAGCLDRLQLTIAPVLLGSGRPSLTLPEILDPGDGLRPRVRRVMLGEDTLFDCIFRA